MIQIKLFNLGVKSLVLSEVKKRAGLDSGKNWTCFFFSAPVRFSNLLESQFFSTLDYLYSDYAIAHCSLF